MIESSINTARTGGINNQASTRLCYLTCNPQSSLHGFWQSPAGRLQRDFHGQGSLTKRQQTIDYL